jgi:GT2 family glycosyltransferase
LEEQGILDRLIISSINLGKNPMMRRLFEDIRTDFVWWFDDDSFVTEADALPARLEIAAQADPLTVMWGQVYYCDHREAFWDGDPVAFVRSAPWYRGLPPPFWEVGGKGELDYNGQGTGDGRWFFLVGGGWFARHWALRQLDWPDRRLFVLGEDVFLGEAVRQQGWAIQDIGERGVTLNAAPRRWTRSQS